MKELRLNTSGPNRVWMLSQYAILNFDTTVCRDWELSSKPSPAKWAVARKEALMARTPEGAATYMKNRAALGIVFSGRIWKSPFPDGCVFYNLSAPIPPRSSLILGHARSLPPGKRAFIGNALNQDGAKFSSAVYLPDEPPVLIIARSWVPKIATLLNAEERFVVVR